MEEKDREHVDSLSKEASMEQGGAYRDQGPDSTGGKGGGEKKGDKSDR